MYKRQLDSIANVAINLTVVAILYIGGNLTGAGAMEIGGITAVTEDVYKRQLVDMPAEQTKCILIIILLLHINIVYSAFILAFNTAISSFKLCISL